MIRSFLIAFLAVVVPMGGGSLADEHPPNIMLIVSDDQGYGDLGCYGNAEIVTPNLDRLARDGVRLTNFYAAWPACTPSRASLLTGRYPQRHGLYDMLRNEAPDYGKRYTPEEYAVTFERVAGLDTREVLVSDLLQRAGYRCGMVGKWDLGMQRRFLPLARGFDDFYGFVNTGIDYFTHERYGVPSMYRGNDPTHEDRGEYSTWLFEREAARFIRDSADQPFFLYLAFNAPHGASSLDPKICSAAQATPELQAMYPKLRATYSQGTVYGRPAETPSREHRRLNHMASLTGMDQSIGRLLDLLAELQLEDRTLVIFLSDNGAAANGDNGLLRGRKGDVWEGGIRVPCIVRFPGVLAGGSICDALLTALEITPTALAAAGTEAPDNITFDGRDMLPVLMKTSSSARSSMFWQRRGDKAARVGNWKWVSVGGNVGLYDLSTDPGEDQDLAEAHPEKASEMAARFEEWRQKMAASEPRGPFRDY